MTPLMPQDVRLFVLILGEGEGEEQQVFVVPGEMLREGVVAQLAGLLLPRLIQTIQYLQREGQCHEAKRN